MAKKNPRLEAFDTRPGQVVVVHADDAPDDAMQAQLQGWADKRGVEVLYLGTTEDIEIKTLAPGDVLFLWTVAPQTINWQVMQQWAEAHKISLCVLPEGSTLDQLTPEHFANLGYVRTSVALPPQPAVAMIGSKA